MDQLKSFTSEIDNWIDGILETLNWTREGLLQTECRRECPINPEHTMDPESLERHLQCCPLVAKGYTKQELAEDQSSKFFYANAPDVVTIDLDERTIRNVLASAGGPVPEDLPLTVERSVTTFSPAHRLRLYDYCAEVSRAANARSRIKEDDLALLSNIQSGADDKPQSRLEMLAKLRDMKRRRQSYRGKNTHTSKKSHKEVIRDVINNQMEILKQIWQDEKEEKEELKKKNEKKLEKERKDKTKSELSHHRHRSRDRHRSQDQDDGAKPRAERKRHRSRERSTSEERHKHKKHKKSKEDKHKRSKRHRMEDKSGPEENTSKEEEISTQDEGIDEQDKAQFTKTVKIE